MKKFQGLAFSFEGTPTHSPPMTGRPEKFLPPPGNTKMKIKTLTHWPLENLPDPNSSRKYTKFFRKSEAY
jgi:hypothetical protein